MPESMPVLTELPPELDDFISKWKDKPGNLIMILHKVQSIYKYIPRDVALTVSKKLDVPLAKIYGVVTFYHFFKLEKPGEYQIAVCMGTACYLKGADKLIAELEAQLGVGINCTTPDGLFSISAVRCVGCCGLAPALTVNGEVHGCVKPEQIKGILDSIRSKKGS